MANYIIYITFIVVSSLFTLNAETQGSPRIIDEEIVLEADNDEIIDIPVPNRRHEEIRRLVDLDILETLGSPPNSKRMWRVRPSAAKKPASNAAKPGQGKLPAATEPRKPLVRPPLVPAKPGATPAAATPAQKPPAKPQPPPQPQLHLAPDMMAITPQIFDTAAAVNANKPKPQGVQAIPAQNPQQAAATKPTPAQQPQAAAATKPVAPQLPQAPVAAKPAAAAAQPTPPKKPQPPPQPQLVLAPEMNAVIPQVFDPVGNRPMAATTARPVAIPAPTPTASAIPVQMTAPPTQPAVALSTLAAEIPTQAAAPTVATPAQTGILPDAIGVKVQPEAFVDPEPFIPVVIERETTPLPAPASAMHGHGLPTGSVQALPELPVHEHLYPDFSLTTEPFVQVVIERDTTPHPQYEPPVFIATTERPPPPPMPGQLPPPVSADLLANAHLPMPNQRPPTPIPQQAPAPLKPAPPQPLILVTPQQPQLSTPRPIQAPATYPPAPVGQTPRPQSMASQATPTLPSPIQSPPQHSPAPTQQQAHLTSPQSPPQIPLQPQPQMPSAQATPHLPSLQPPTPTLSPPQQIPVHTPPIQQQTIQTAPSHPIAPATLATSAAPPPAPSTIPPYTPPTIVLPNGGQLIGSVMETTNGKPIDAFRGIPYANPPVGRLRFQPPEPHPPITGARKAQHDASPCPQHEYLDSNATFGHEDCLYLNVYTPQNRSVMDTLPVMVFFHGGGFNFGSSHSSVYGPERLLAHDVILVTGNYRLGALGFLSTGTLDCPGNNGLKDQVEILKWVQANIEAFGGNPKNVTIFGQSSGAASVTYHLVSPKTEGLFDKAIVQSGTNYDCWAYIQNRTATYRAKRLRMMLDCTADGSWPNVLDCLRTKSTEEIVSAANAFYSFGKDPITAFGPVVEPEHPDAYLTEKPRNIVRPHSVHLPLMIGVNAEEGVIKSGPLTHLYDEAFREKFRKVLPKLLYYDDWPKQTRLKITNKVDKFYFKGNHSWTREDPGELTALFSERLFYSGMDQYLRNRFAQRNGTFGDTYAYLFDQKGPITLSAQYGSGPFYYGVAHGDELPYLFTMNATNAPSTYNDGRFKWALPRMWTDFAMTGNPTPGDSPVRKWKPATKFKLRYAHIGSKNVTDLVVIRNSVGFMDPKMRFWRGVQTTILTDSADNEPIKLIP